MEKLTPINLAELGYKLEYNESINKFFYQKEDVTIYDTIDGFKYQNTSIIINDLSHLNQLIIDEYGED
jgi:hypothetical protein